MTPKPGQIRCPTCHRSTPPAAYCTQCGSPIPASARVRPRGMDRDELEERIRGRRPGESFRRGSVPDEGGYVRFQPEPEDQLAVREADEQPTRRVDRIGEPPPVTRPVAPGLEREPERRAAAPSPPPVREPEPRYEEPAAYEEPRYEEEYPAYADEPYGAPEDAYAYPYAEERRGGSSALPIIGFAALCVLALAVGAVLAGLFTGDDNVGLTTPSPTAQATTAATPVPSVEATPVPSGSAAPATPEPSDGPVAFPDGALLTIQPCASSGYREDAIGRPNEAACQDDGSTVSTGDVWVLVVFADTGGDDALRVRLVSNGEVIDEQNTVLSSILTNCGGSCNGLIYGARYQGLSAGSYELVLHRNGEFADRASFTVGG